MGNVAHILKEVRIDCIAMKVEVEVQAAHWGLTLCAVHGILQARILEWVAFPFSRGSSQLRDCIQVSCIAGRFFLPIEPQGKPILLLWSEVKSLSRVWRFATPWTVAHQAPHSMGFSRQEYWSGLQFPSP